MPAAVVVAVVPAVVGGGSRARGAGAGGVRTGRGQVTGGVVVRQAAGDPAGGTQVVARTDGPALVGDAGDHRRVVDPPRRRVEVVHAVLPAQRLDRLAVAEADRD